MAAKAAKVGTRFVLKYLLICGPLAMATLPAVAADFRTCKGGHRVTCVVDGDTFWFRGEKIRVDGYDSPEMGQPKCSRPAAGAVEARNALTQLLNSGTVELDRTGVDRYGRTLARVLVNGQDITETMIDAGHARRYQRGQQAWC
jgi:endonuclease YncB( thermonuclease family)